MIHKERMTATLEGDFVVFLIGLRINNPMLVHKWGPVLEAMRKMLIELYKQPELGFLSHESYYGRTTLMVQYWRSMAHLHTYASAREAAHLPAWHAFNKAVGQSGTVGIWHETYQIKAGGYETIYGNMPPFGLGKVGTLQTIKGARETAAGRLAAEAKSA
jgi:hypothetical protein